MHLTSTKLKPFISKHADLLWLLGGICVLFLMFVSFAPFERGISAWSACMVAATAAELTRTLLDHRRRHRQADITGQPFQRNVPETAIASAILLPLCFVLSKHYPFLLPTEFMLLVGILGGIPLGQRKPTDNKSTDETSRR
jgi:hypothetical protein